MYIKSRREKKEAAGRLMIGAMAARGDGAHVKKLAGKWAKGDD